VAVPESGDAVCEVENHLVGTSKSLPATFRRRPPGKRAQEAWGPGLGLRFDLGEQRESSTERKQRFGGTKASTVTEVFRILIYGADKVRGRLGSCDLVKSGY